MRLVSDRPSLMLGMVTGTLRVLLALLSRTERRESISLSDRELDFPVEYSVFC